jgi:DNA-binding protein HU-beta
MSITIKELTAVAADSAGITKKAAETALEQVFGVMADSLKSGTEVTVRDFGRFYVKTRGARVARNPKTGESVNVPEKQIVKFSPRGAMK